VADRAGRELIVATLDDYQRATLRARERWLRGAAGTLARLRRLYRRSAAGVRDDIRATTPGTFRERHLLAVLAGLERRAEELSGEVLEAVRAGIRLSVDAAIAGPRTVTQALLAPAYTPSVVAEYFGQVNERALVALLDRTGPDGLQLSERTWRIGRRWRRAVQTVVEDGVARGLDTRTLAREAQRYLTPGVFTPHKAETRRRLGVPKDVSYEAVRLARTELGNAFHEGTIAGNQAAPSYQGILWRLSLSHIIPDVCDDIAGNRRYGRRGFYPAGKEPAKPHPQCLPGGTLVSGPRAIGSTTRWYEGDLVEIHTLRGRFLAITPNHPVLTPKGWVAAGALHEGSDVVCGGGREWDGAGGAPPVQYPHDHQVPSLIEDVAHAVGESLGVASLSVPVTAEDFHGDGLGSEVCVVRTDGLLRYGLDSPVPQPDLEELLRGRDTELAVFPSARDLAFVVERLWLPAAAHMRERRQAPVLLGSAVGRSEPDGLDHRAPLYARCIEEAANRPARYAEALGEALLGFTSQIATDQIVRIGRRPFSGHVYNLQTPNGWYIANDVVVHNCLCVVLPAHEDPDDFTDRLLAWIDDPGTQPDLERWYEGVASPLLGRPLAPLSPTMRGEIAA
jgi:hypothetical protein